VGQEVKGTSSGRLPISTSACVTLEAVNRGPGRFGRFFLPGIAQGVNTDWRWSVSEVTAMLTPTVTYLKALSDSIDIPDSLVSVPLVNESNVGTGTEQQVDFVRMGRVPDNISRRRNKLLEEYVSSGDIDW
jgi:hypothetical protein